MQALEECVEQGRDPAPSPRISRCAHASCSWCRPSARCPPELTLTPEADEALRAQAERVEHATVVRLLELLGEAMEGVRAGADWRTRLELALVKAAKPALDSSMRALLARIERLEAGGSAAGRASRGGARRPAAAPAAGHRAARPRSLPPRRGGTGRRSRRPGRGPPPVPAPAAPEGAAEAAAAELRCAEGSRPDPPRAGEPATPAPPGCPADLESMCAFGRR